MPRRDGTGPAGQGSGTGRRMGPCNPAHKESQIGHGKGRGRGNCRGVGRGKGKGAGQGGGSR